MDIQKIVFYLENEYKEGGEIWIMTGLDLSKPDIVDIRHIAECFARLGSRVVIPHPVHYKSELYPIVFSGLIGTKYERKCSDLIIDGKYYEYESFSRPWNKRKLSNMLTNGLRQSDRIIIDNRDGSSIRQIIRAIRSRINVNAVIREVWIYDGEDVLDIYP